MRKQLRLLFFCWLNSIWSSKQNFAFAANYFPTVMLQLLLSTCFRCSIQAATERLISENLSQHCMSVRGVPKNKNLHGRSICMMWTKVWTKVNKKGTYGCLSSCGKSSVPGQPTGYRTLKSINLSTLDISASYHKLFLINSGMRWHSIINIYLEKTFNVHDRLLESSLSERCLKLSELKIFWNVTNYSNLVSLLHFSDFYFKNFSLRFHRRLENAFITLSIWSLSK